MHFQRLLLLFVASNSGKKVLRLDATSYQSSGRTEQHLCLWLQMSTSGSSERNSHLTQGGRTTMMTMPVNLITSQSKIKLSQKYCPWINLQLWNFCHDSFLQWMGIFFLDYYVLLCNTCLYRSVHRHGHHCHSSSWLRCEFLAELPLVLIFWS